MRWVNPPAEQAASKSPNATSKAVLSLPRTTTSNVRVDTTLPSSSWSLTGLLIGWWSNRRSACGVTESDPLKTMPISKGTALLRYRSLCRERWAEGHEFSAKPLGAW